MEVLKLRCPMIMSSSSPCEVGFLGHEMIGLSLREHLKGVLVRVDTCSSVVGFQSIWNWALIGHVASTLLKQYLCHVILVYGVDV